SPGPRSARPAGPCQASCLSLVPARPSPLAVFARFVPFSLAAVTFSAMNASFTTRGAQAKNAPAGLTERGG
ncbi:MAG: hypothetical protein CVV64_22830, partial [Candidatus Wallbacteria bacterium HGW-Wallbacteria-1]